MQPLASSEVHTTPLCTALPEQRVAFPEGASGGEEMRAKWNPYWNNPPRACSTSRYGKFPAAAISIPARSPQNQGVGFSAGIRSRTGGRAGKSVYGVV
jgi:hypothetical protein